MLIVTEDTVMNRAALETRSLPKKFFGRVTLVPRGGGVRLWLRLMFEMQILRYLGALLPFVAMALFVPSTALGITQAPLAMVVVIGVVELKVLRLSDKGRKALVDEDEVARRLDTLSFRAKACLRRIAARHEIDEGDLRLVVEQSELARVPPLTLVTVQTDDPEPMLLPLDEGDRAVLREGLFDDALSERDLLAANHREEMYIREIAQEARGVSAHGRLAAKLEKRAQAQEA